MHGTPPAPGHGTGAPGRAEQPAGDGGDGVGVVADADGGVQGLLQVQTARLVDAVADRRRSDRRGGRLQRGDRVAVGAEAGRVDVGVGALVDPGGPLGLPVGGQQVEPGPEPALLAQHGRADRLAPQHAGVASQRVGVRQLGYRTSRPGQVVAVVEVGERDGRRPHQGPVAGRVRVLTGVALRLLTHHPGRACFAGVEPAAGAAQHGTGLDADVGRAVAVPA